ncbi:MAG: U3 snoRNP protein [Geoglossum umbratile]|nr:MAG: U3 snoRNP protein [Geoglossum umbratile]
MSVKSPVARPEKARPAHGPSRVKTGTESSRHHRFRSFSQRIAKLTIDPIRRVRRHDLETEDLSTATSYFKNSLEQWVDLNVSENFSRFAREVSPLCGSLPQLLYFEDRVIDLLLRYIEMKDSLSLEPLLSLLSHFAHDLGVRFEKYFSRTVTLVASLAAKHSDIEVIEWSFTCLAWLFKYLSRLLVSDLRPLFGIMAVLLGKERQKPFVTRFAAEAMSFLVRKAGAVHHKDISPLELLARHALRDLKRVTDSKSIMLYQAGLMELFSDAIKGVQRGIHSSGYTIFECLLEVTQSAGGEENRHAEDVVAGVLVSLIHHSDADTFNPILKLILRHAERLESDSENLRYLTQLISTVVTVRKGSRISDWGPILSVAMKLLKALPTVRGDQSASNSDLAWRVFAVTAEVLQSSPIETVIPHIRPIMEEISEERHIHAFLPFCNYFAELGNERFRSIVLPYFEKYVDSSYRKNTKLIAPFRFVLSHWSQSENELGALIPKLLKAGSLTKSRTGDFFLCPKEWQVGILETFESLDSQLDKHGDEMAIQSWRDLCVLDSTSVDPLILEGIAKHLRRWLEAALRSLGSRQKWSDLATGGGFASYVQITAKAGNWDITLWPTLCASSPYYANRPKFLEALLTYISNHPCDLEMTDNVVEPLLNSLITNLAMSSHDLRSISLRILNALYDRRGGAPSAIATAILIEESPLTLDAARSMSMHTRKLAASYPEVARDPWLSKAVPYFCFGLLTVKLASVWDDACIALKEITRIKGGGDIVTDLAFRWLESPTGFTEDDRGLKPLEGGRKRLTDFECPNQLRHYEIARGAEEEVRNAVCKLQDNFNHEHRSTLSMSPNARSQALRLLCEIPQMAEKRSRQIVPMFLDWAANDEEREDDSPILDVDSENGLLEPRDQTSRWTRKDQTSMLALFAGFINPKSLYKSSEVYNALLTLLASGDSNIQKSALRVIFTYKSPSIRPYEENLLNILDDARFRDEIAIFVQVNEDESKIQREHRADVIPLLLRILYGRSITRKGAASGKRGMEGGRLVIMRALASFPIQELGEFVKIVLGKLNGLEVVHDGSFNEAVLNTTNVAIRRQVGFIKMVEDLLKVVGMRLLPFSEDLLKAILFSLVGASRTLNENRRETEAGEALQYSMLKSIRQIGFKCLNLMFAKCEGLRWEAYMAVIFRELINPRLEKLPIETAQSVSGVLQLFATWSASAKSVLFLTDYNDGVMAKLADCLVAPSVKDEVRLFALSVVKNVVSHAQDKGADPERVQERVAHELLQPNADRFLVRIGELLRQSPGKAFLESGVEAVSQLAPFVAGSSEAKNLVDISIFLLNQPSRRVNPKTKNDLLRILQHFVPLYDIQDDILLQTKLLNTVSSLFGYFKDRDSREVLSNVLTVLSHKDAELREVAELCDDLNSFSITRLDEPDFNSRLKAFRVINEEKFADFTVKQWRPIIYNSLFYIKDNEELAIRANSSYSLRRFIEGAFARFGTDEEPCFREALTSILIPALRNGAREQSELVRAEYVGTMAHLVKRFTSWSEVSDMSTLLVGDDEEASFFNNILHIQLHRRLRALRRLSMEAQNGNLRSGNVSHFFIPLIEHFIFDRADDESAHNLTSETVVTIGLLAEWLEWPQFRAMFRRFVGYIQERQELEKVVIRLLGTVVDALSRAAIAKTRESDVGDAMKHSEGVDPEEDIKMTGKPQLSTLAVTMPDQSKLADDLTKGFLPSLTTYLHNKDDSTVSLRVPVAVTIVKLLKLVPFDSLSDCLPPILTDVCHILRSRAQESRDITRKTLAEISTILGPACFGFILKELRGALGRGYQLHVLSYTVHSILVETAPNFMPGDLDYCMPQIVTVIMDDIFGVTGQEKDAEDYISKMKEVKSSKSYDSMELIARTTTLQRLAELVRPIQSLLGERLNLKIVKKIDELLRRIGIGLLQNEAVHSRDLLVFCYELIQEVYKAGASTRTGNDKQYRTQRYLISLKGAKQNENRGSTSSYTYKLTRFSFDILRSVLHKHQTLQTTSNLAGFMPIIGDALAQSQEEVQISAVRLLTTIIKVPLASFDHDAVVYVAQAVSFIKACPSTNAELAQASLKLISAILRERQNIEVKETSLAYLLKRLKPDLEEPDRQGVTFNFLKAVMSRKIVITEVYEVLDTVSAIMVTNHTRSVRDLARGAYFQFVMEYPQGKQRFAKQLAFLVKNLEYQHQEGRQSILEVIHLLLTKIGNSLIQEITSTFFVPLVMVLVNDDSTECRQMAGVLLKEIFERTDKEGTQRFTSLLSTWLGQDEQVLLIRVALQCYGIYYDVHGANDDKELSHIQGRLLHILEANNKPNAKDMDWELLYFSLQTLSKICHIFPSAVFSASSEAHWTAVRSCLRFPHAWVKLSATKLLGLYFAEFAKANVDRGFESIPLESVGGLKLGANDMLELTRESLRMLRVPGVGEELVAQIVRNLMFLGKCLGANRLERRKPKDADPSNRFESEEEGSDTDKESRSRAPSNQDEPRLAFQFLLERLSSILRRETLVTRAESLIPKTASLQLLGALCTNIPPTSLQPLLQTILLPLHNLTDPSIPAPASSNQSFTEGYKSLVATAGDIMSLLQTKMGTSEFVMELTKVREGVRMRREGRRVKRRIETLAEPEKAERNKRRKGERKKERRKEKGQEERQRRNGAVW